MSLPRSLAYVLIWNELMSPFPCHSSVTAETPKSVRDFRDSRLLVLRRDIGEKTSHNEKDEEQSHAEDHKLGRGWVSCAVGVPLFAESAKVFFQLLASKLVVNETSKGDTVTKELHGRNGVAEDDHGCEDEEDILQHTRKSKDNSVRATNLCHD